MSDEHREEALRLIQVGHGVVQKIRDAAPEDRDPYGKQAMGIWAQAQVHATLAVAAELHTLNSDRSQWYREVLEVLTAAKDGDGSLRSGQPAAATSCQVCGRLGSDLFCKSGELTWDQWMDHFDAFHRERRAAGATRMQAHDFADEMMSDRFGPCPEES